MTQCVDNYQNYWIKCSREKPFYRPVGEVLKWMFIDSPKPLPASAPPTAAEALAAEEPAAEAPATEAPTADAPAADAPAADAPAADAPAAVAVPLLD